MNPEVKSILEAIEKHSTSQKIGSIFAESRTEKRLIVLAIISFFLTLLLSLISWEIWAIYAGIIFLLAMISLTIVQTITTVHTFKRPLSGYASGAEIRFSNRMQFIQELATYSPDGLRSTTLALKNDVSRMQKRLYSLVGATDKAGFIPAGITLYYAASKISSGNEDIAVNMLMAFVFGLYGGAFLVNRIIDSLSVNISCLEEAQSIAEIRNKIEKA